MATLIRKLFAQLMDENDGGGSGGVVDRGDVVDPVVPSTTEQEDHTKAAKAIGLKTEKEEAEETEEEKKPEAKADKEEPRIPKSRLDKVLGQLKDAQERLAALEGGKQQETVDADLKAAGTRLSDMEKLLTKQIADGETDKAAQTLAEMRALQEAIADYKADVKATQATAQAVEQVRESMVIDRIEEAYPELNPKHEDYDEDKIAKVLKLKHGLMATGDSSSAALQEAVKLVMGAPTTTKEKTAVEVTPRVDKDKIAADRAAEAKKRNAEVAGKQPPTTAKVGVDSDKLGGGTLKPEDVMAMSQDEFAKLDEKTLAKLRGDEV